MERLHPQSDYEKAEFMYIQGHLNYSRAFHGKWPEADGKARRASAQEALRFYTGAAEILRGLNPANLAGKQVSYHMSFIGLLDLNAVETKWQMAKHGHILPTDCLEWIAKQDVLGRLRSALLVPQNLGVWTIPHNGLIFASQLNDLEAMEFFYGELVKVQPGFISWDFTPGETPTLRDDKDLEAFRRAFVHLDRKENTAMNMKVKILASIAAATLVTFLLHGAALALALASNM